MNVWDRQPSEGGQAYAAFCHYRDLGPDRTIDAAFRAARGPKGPSQGPEGTAEPQAIPRANGCWKRWAEKHAWRDRALAWDHRTDQIVQDAREKVIATVSADRAARMLEQEQQEHELKTLMFGKLKEMLETGLTRRKVVKSEDGKTITIIEPAKWTFTSAARLAREIRDLGRVNLQMPTRVDPATSADAPYFDSSGEMDAAMPAGAVPPMPADSRTKPKLAIAGSKDQSGLISPDKPVRPA